MVICLLCDMWCKVIITDTDKFPLCLHMVVYVQMSGSHSSLVPQFIQFPHFTSISVH